MRRSILLAGVLTTSLTLAACGSGDDSTDSTSDGAAGASGALTIWVDDTREAPVAAAAEAFTEETGVEVELVQKNFEDVRPDFLAQVPTGEGPDITVGAHDWLGEFVNNGVVAPLEIGDKAAEFDEVALQVYTYDGQLYGLPYGVENVALIRNTALAPEAPATWDDMVAAGQAAGTPFPVLVQSNGEAGDPYTHYPMQTSFGSTVFAQDAEGRYTSELTLGGEEGKAYAAWLAAQGAAGVLDIDTTYDIVVEEFKNGNSPFIIGGPWMVASFEGLDLAIDPVPSAGGLPSQPFMGAPGFYVSAQSDNQLLANEFLVDYMSTVEAQVALYEVGDRLPAVTAAAEQVAASDPIVAGFRDAAADAVPAPSIPEMASVWTYWGNTEAAIVSGKADPAEAWDKMVSDIQGAIDAS
jgi:arabinogalactan oligomer / maltooligosaccharide transport system substrate-binding protein